MTVIRLKATEGGDYAQELPPGAIKHCSYIQVSTPRALIVV